LLEVGITEDYALYRNPARRAAEVEIRAWCLMPNHVHLILAPSDPDGLRRALSNAATRPACKAIMDRRRRTILQRAIAPAATAL
jgi:putative transposase